jgi:hypothetical protein
MTIDWEKKEVHFVNPSLEELALWLSSERDKLGKDFKIMIDEYSKDGDFEG